MPSRNLVIVRMGRDPGSLFGFMSEKWERLAEVTGTPTSASSSSSSSSDSGTAGSGSETPGSGSETPGSGSEKPDGFRLDQNYPNPFNPSTLITYHIPSPEPVRLEVFDITGRCHPTGFNRLMYTPPASPVASKSTVCCPACRRSLTRTATRRPNTS